jgi:hypothetical protein
MENGHQISPNSASREYLHSSIRENHTGSLLSVANDFSVMDGLHDLA